jgi:outer membrane lipoprotein-sorting protein
LVLSITAAARASVDEALDALHQSGVDLKSLAADVTLRTTSGDLGDDRTRVGTFVMQKLADGNTRVRASFTKTISGNRTTLERRDYVLSGTDLIDRDYSASPKKQTTTQVRKPGEKVDLLKLGEGPFPLPVGQSRQDVLKEFDVEEQKTDDPTALALIKLSPKPKTPLAEKFKWITVLIDRTTKLPKVVTTADPQEVDVNTATLSNLRVNGDVKDAEFELERINPTDWNLIDQR